MSEFNTQTDEEPIDILDVIQLLLDNAKFIVIATISIGILSALYISSVERTYVATTLIKSSSKVGSTGDSAASGLAGLRIGFALGNADVLNRLNRITGPYDINSFAVRAAFAALADQVYVDNYISEVLKARDWIKEQLKITKIRLEKLL